MSETIINPADFLPVPQAIDDPKFEVLFQAWLVEMEARDPDFDAGSLEVDPGVIVAEAMSYVRMLDRVSLNDKYRALRLALATGTNLDGLAADRGVTRLILVPADGTTSAVLESDTSLRLRTWLAMQTWGAGSPFGIEYHARTAGLGDIADAQVIDYPGEGRCKLVLLQPADVDEDFDFGAVVARVGAYVMDRRRRPGAVWIDTVAADLTPVDLAGTIFVRRGASLASNLASAELAWRDYMKTRRRIGSDIPYSAVDDAIITRDIIRFDMAPEPLNIVVGETEATEAGAWNVTAEVTDE